MLFVPSCKISDWVQTWRNWFGGNIGHVCNCYKRCMGIVTIFVVFQSEDLARLEQMRLNRTISGHANRLRMNDSHWDDDKDTNNARGTRRKLSIMRVNC